MEITSPPGSPASGIQRPMSAMMRPPRSSSRMSVSSRAGGGSRASDEDSKTAVKVGAYSLLSARQFASLLTRYATQPSAFALR